MAISLQLPPGSVVLSNRFGDGPFDDCERFVRVVLPQGIEIEGVYNAPRGVQPECYRLYTFALRNGEPAWTRGTRWAPTEKGAAAMLAQPGSNDHSRWLDRTSLNQPRHVEVLIPLHSPASIGPTSDLSTMPAATQPRRCRSDPEETHWTKVQLQVRSFSA